MTQNISGYVSWNVYILIVSTLQRLDKKHIVDNFRISEFKKKENNFLKPCLVKNCVYIAFGENLCANKFITLWTCTAGKFQLLGRKKNFCIKEYAY